jgi:SAM-dependent methyltransferase
MMAALGSRGGQSGSHNRAELESQLRALLALTEARRPNGNALNEALRNIPAICLNLKTFGYELARAQGALRPPWPELLEPSRVGLRCKPSTQADIESAWVAYWMSRLKAPVIYHRKIWELCYVLQAIYEHELMRPGARGLGFGCGEEPLPSLMASEGVDVVVTDLPPDDARARAWRDTGQHADSRERSFRADLATREAFDAHVQLRYVDMNAIPGDLRGFDFCWSICALEHLGSIANGLRFIERSLDCLRPGGLAVHTTEFNYGNDHETIDDWPTVLFQRAHFAALAERLRARGYLIDELDFDVGDRPLDRYIDLPPWPHDAPASLAHHFDPSSPAHIKLSVDGFPTTCFGMIVRRPE